MNKEVSFFMRKVKINPETQCWIWQGYKMGKYPMVKIEEKKQMAHRVSYELFIGKIPKHHCVRQRCEQSACVNPEHLKVDHSDKVIKPIQERFLEKVKKTEGCWYWMGFKNKEGYGSFQTKNGAQRAHRISYKLFVGDLRSNELVCHRCDNPSCVNPSHLFVGMNRDNSNDKVQKKRHCFGEFVHSHKLTEGKVLKIRKEYKVKITTHRKLAKKYGVACSAISNVLNLKTWRHV